MLNLSYGTSMNVHNFRILLSFLKPVRSRLFLACVLQTFASLVTLVPFAAIVYLSERTMVGQFSMELAYRVSAYVLGAIVARIAFSISASALCHFADNDFHFHVRRRFIQSFDSVPLRWFLTHQSGELKKLLQDDINAMHQLVAHFSMDAIHLLVWPTVIVVYLASYSASFMAIALVPAVASFIVYLWQIWHFSKHLDEYDARLTEINNATVELVQGIAPIKLFSPEKGVPKRFQNATSGFAKAFTSWTRGLIPFSSANEVLVSPLASVLWICLTGTLFIQQGWLEPIEILPFLLVGTGLGGPLQTISGTYTQLQKALEAAGRVAALFHQKPLPVPASPQEPRDAAIQFDNVTFSYAPGSPVIKNVSFSIAPGSLTALVGPSGAGKSTLANLLLRFADPDSGHIRIGGVSLTDIAPDTLHQYISFVFQDPYLLRASIYDNIALASTSPSHEEVERAARLACIHERIMECPKGYDSIIGQDVQFSGGESQRLSIARAFLADSPILVLDEPTAHADPLSERALQQAISHLAANRTVLVIAHRLKSIVNAEQIIVMDKGHIAEKGRHEELLANEGVYCALWSIATQDQLGAKPAPSPHPTASQLLTTA